MHHGTRARLWWPFWLWQESKRRMTTHIKYVKSVFVKVGNMTGVSGKLSFSDVYWGERASPSVHMCVKDAKHIFVFDLLLRWWTPTRLRQVSVGWFGFQRSLKHFLSVRVGPSHHIKKKSCSVLYKSKNTSHPQPSGVLFKPETWTMTYHHCVE